MVEKLSGNSYRILSGYIQELRKSQAQHCVLCYPPV